MFVLSCLITALAAPSPGIWISAETPLQGGAIEMAGSAEGWMVVGRDGDVISGQRVASDGTLLDSLPTFLMSSDAANPVVWWDGTDFVTVSVLSYDYYDNVATVGATRWGPVAAAPTAPEVVASGLGWPSALAGACDSAGRCEVALNDSKWDVAPHGSWRFAFADGAPEPVAPLDDGASEVPSDGAADGDAALVVTRRVSPVDPRLDAVWLSQGLAPHRLTVFDGPHGAPRVAVADDGTALVVWLSADNQLVAQRIVRDGVLDEAPVELGIGRPGSEFDVAFDGTAFVVASCTFLDEERHVVRVGVSGDLIDMATLSSPACSLPRLAAGAPGHLLWSWSEGGDYRFVALEADVPLGGVCHEDGVCSEGTCDAGVCVPEADTAVVDTSTVDTAVVDTSAADSAPTGTGLMDTGGSTGTVPAGALSGSNSCGCATGVPWSPAWLIGLACLVARRRREGP